MLILVILLSNNIAFGRNMSTYDYLSNYDSQLIERFRSGGLRDEVIKGFMDSMDKEADALQKPEDIETLESYFIQLLVYCMLKEEYMPVQIALDMRFKDELEYMNQERVPEAFQSFFKSVMYDKVEPPASYPIHPVEEEPERTAEPVQTPTPEPTPTPTPIFSDLENCQWAEPHINALFKKNIISGYNDNTFKPENYITRAEIAKLVSISFLDASYSYEKSFYSDVTSDDWFFKYLVNGEYFSLYQNIYEGSFSPDEPITRQEMCAIIYRAVRRGNVELPKKEDAYEFYDFYLFSNYAYDPIRELQKGGIVNGVGDNNFAPNALATRAEVAKIINLLIDLK
jgi:hypothetical protein